MKEQKISVTGTQKNAKTNIYNVVILDMSGSMQAIKQEAISGYNNTLLTIQAAQQKYADTQNHFVTLVIFNSSAIKMECDCVACTKAKELTDKSYRPDSYTPLYDTMGFTLSKFRKTIDRATDYKVLVTIITDGDENDSKKYTGRDIYQMVSELKSFGWVFTYIGANHDVEKFAKTIAVNNTLTFVSTGHGTKEMYMRESKHRMNFYDRISNYADDLQNGYFIDSGISH